MTNYSHFLQLPLRPFKVEDPDTHPEAYEVEDDDPDADPNDNSYSLLSDFCIVVQQRDGQWLVHTGRFWGIEKEWLLTTDDGLVKDHDILYWCYASDLGGPNQVS